MTSVQERKIRQTGCDARFDNLTRQLYATDASIYQIEPVGVAFPKSAQQASAVIRAAADAGLSITPRGAGTSLVGNAIGEGLIVDFARHNRQITDLDLEKRSVRVGAGVVLDQLNEFLTPHGFCFGPDVATSSRATLGGMIANNSSGARCPIYGTTSDHVISLEIVMADGRIETEWGDNPQRPGQWITIDLGAVREVYPLECRHRAPFCLSGISKKAFPQCCSGFVESCTFPLVRLLSQVHRTP